MTHVCYFQRLGYTDCSPGIRQRMHWIPKQRLRIAGLDLEAIWDERIWSYGCQRHHHLLDMKFLPVSRDQLPVTVEDYAREHGMLWSLERDYGEREMAA